MVEHDNLAERFEANRPHLRAVAYRMLGSLTEADDAVQEAWLRLSRTDTSAVENLGGWLTTVTARVCLDMLRARASRREELVSPHVTHPIVTLEVVLRADGGVGHPATALVRGAAEVAGRALTFARPQALVQPVLVNGAAGVVVTARGRPVSVMGFTVTDGKIVAIDALVDVKRL